MPIIKDAYYVEPLIVVEGKNRESCFVASAASGSFDGRVHYKKVSNVTHVGMAFANLARLRSETPNRVAICPKCLLAVAVNAGRVVNHDNLTGPCTGKGLKVVYRNRVRTEGI